MKKIILVTGSTDGIGFETAKILISQGHTILLHGRNPSKLEDSLKTLSAVPGGGLIETYEADLSRFDDVEALAKAVTAKHATLDVLNNNAGILKASNPITADGLDVRFVVNTLAPYLLTQRLLPLRGTTGRVINLSSAAQDTVDIEALAGRIKLSDMPAYAQSKLAITMWSRVMADEHPNGPAVIPVNPGSLLASKMVKEGFGVAGNDLSIGAEVLIRAALSDEFADASGKYFDNDAGRFTDPHPDALDAHKSEAVVSAIETVLAEVAS